MARRAMDIWAWVNRRSDDLRKAGQGRVAELIWSIPRDQNEDKVEQVQAVMPEAIAAARALEDPWLEVYFRHWGMQNRLNNLCEGESALADATAALEFAHREETKDCPQSVCATQDLSIVYGNTDGPGYAPERMEVVDETLARINPTWQCFTCLSIEHSSTLEDMGRFDEAHAYMDRQTEALENAGEEVDSRFRWHQANILPRLGRAEEALKLFDELDALDDSSAEDDRVSRAINRAWALATLGRIDEAWELLPKWSDLTPSDYPNWTETLEALVAARPELNTWNAGGAFQSALDYTVKVGSIRFALDIALRHGRLAVGRGARTTATRALAAARAMLPRLHRAMDAPARVQALSDMIEAMPAAPQLPVPAAELLDHLRSAASDNLERDLEWLLAASRERPDDVDLHLATANVMHALTLKQQGVELLLRDLESHPGERRLVNGVLGLAHGWGGDDVYQRLVTLVEPHDPFFGHVVRSVWSQARDNWSEAMTQASAALELRPDDHDATMMLAGSAFKAGEYEKATTSWLRTLAADGAKMEAHEGWNLLAAASACRNWDAVREVAARKSMELTGTGGVVEEDWEACIVVFSDAGIERRYGAQRTGPVTARIMEPAQLDETQHAGDWVVFDATPVDPPPDDEEERKRFWYTYRVVHVLEPGGFGETWLLDGAHPRDEEWATLRDGIRARHWAGWNVTGPDYRVTDPSGNLKNLRGFLVFVAAPRFVTPAEVHDALTEMTTGWRHPLSWLKLAEAAGKDVERHQSIVDRYGL
jgi:tetratricopeptide (TPR) repeat protein